MKTASPLYVTKYKKQMFPGISRSFSFSHRFWPPRSGAIKSIYPGLLFSSKQFCLNFDLDFTSIYLMYTIYVIFHLFIVSKSKKFQLI